MGLNTVLKFSTALTVILNLHNNFVTLLHPPRVIKFSLVDVCYLLTVEYCRFHCLFQASVKWRP